MHSSRFLTSAYTHLPPRIATAIYTTTSSRLISSSTRRTHKPASTFQFHGLGTRSYSFRRAGGIRGLIAKRGLNLNSSSGLPHLPRRSTLQKSTIHAGLLGTILGAFSSSSAKQDEMSYPVQKTDQEWRAVLSPEQFRILRQQGTEAARSGEYDKHHVNSGVYNCAACGTPLYKATTKFKSGCGWPAFYENLPGKVLRRVDSSYGMARTEIVCANCGGHLGHVFQGEGFKTPTDERHCVNSVSLKFVDEEGEGASNA